MSIEHGLPSSPLKMKTGNFLVTLNFLDNMLDSHYWINNGKGIIV